MIGNLCFVLLWGSVLAYHQGVIYEQDGDVILTDSRWTLVLQYNLTEVEAENQNLSVVLKQVKGQYEYFFKSISYNASVVRLPPLPTLEAGFQYEYVSLQQLLKEYVGKASDLVSLLPRMRVRRGLVDAGGRVLKFLFGTLDSTDLENINNDLEATAQLTDDIYHSTKDQLTVMGSMQDELTAHSRSINQIIVTLNEYHKIMHETLARSFSRDQVLASQIQIIVKYLKLTTALSEVKDAVELAVQRMNRFHQALEDLASGKVSTNLLPPHQYLKVLQAVERVVPSPAKLFTEVKYENLHAFYRFASAEAYATPTQLRILVQIPLRTNEQTYEAYNVVSYPVYDSSLQRWVQWEIPHQKLIISKDRQTYATYEPSDFIRECNIDKVTICPLLNVILNVHKRPTCALGLLLQQETALFGRKLMKGLESPVFVRTPSRWVYSTSSEDKAVLNCAGPQGPNVSTIVLSGVGEIPNRERCDLIADGYKVPARFTGSSSYSADFGKLKFPDVNGLFSPEETVLMKDNLNDTLNVLQGLDEQLGTLSVKEYSVETVVHRLKSHRYKVHLYKIVTYIGLPVTLLVIAFLYVLLGYRRQGMGLLSASQLCRGRRSSAKTSETKEAVETGAVDGVPLPAKRESRPTVELNLEEVDAVVHAP